MPFSTSALPVRAHAPQSTCGAAFPAARGGRIPDLGKNGPEAAALECATAISVLGIIKRRRNETEPVLFKQSRHPDGGVIGKRCTDNLHPVGQTCGCDAQRCRR